MQIKIFRWKAIGPLLLLLAIIAMLVVVFAEPIAHDTTEEASTELLGTQVDVGKLDLHPREASVDLRALQIADPFTLTRNLLEADEIRLKLNPEALAEKKLVVERSASGECASAPTRKTPARPVKGGGFAPKILQSVQQWGKQFDVPLLSLTPIDTIRQLVLDPTQLDHHTRGAGAGRAHRFDSSRRWSRDSSSSTSGRRWTLPVRWPSGSPRPIPRSSGWRAPGRPSNRCGRRSARSTLPRSESSSWSGAPGPRRAAPGQGTRVLDQARQKDFAFAKSLLKLPSFRRARHRQRVLRQGEHRALPAGALLGRAGAAVHAARTAAAADLRVRTACGLRATRSSFPGSRNFPGSCWSKDRWTSPLAAPARSRAPTPQRSGG